VDVDENHIRDRRQGLAELLDADPALALDDEEARLFAHEAVSPLRTAHPIYGKAVQAMGQIREQVDNSAGFFDSFPCGIYIKRN
jgi:hypothetical protein